MYFKEKNREQLIRHVEITNDYIKGLENGDFPLEEARRLNGKSLNFIAISEDFNWYN